MFNFNRFKFIVTGILLISLSGCASWFNKIDNVTVLRKSQPYNGPVEIRVGDGTVKGKPLFEMRVQKNEYGGLPQGEFMEQIKMEGARYGANVLVFNCGAAGTTGQTVCIVYGYRE